MRQDILLDHPFCLNEHDIVLGRMREKDVRGSLDAAVEEVMEPGPTTVRSSEAAEGLLKRMRKRNVPTVMVTTSKDGLWSGDTGGSGKAGDATRSSE